MWHDPCLFFFKNKFLSMGPLGCIFVFFIALILAVLVAVSNIVKALFGFTRGMNPFGTDSRTQDRQTYASDAGSRSSDTGKNQSSSSKSKIFDDNEGEYVDYEEIKD